MSLYIFQPRMCPVAIFVLLYFSIFAVAAILTDNREFMLYEVEMALLMALVVYMDKRVTFSPFVLWALSLWGFLHLAGGLIPIPDSLADMNDADPADAVQVLYNMRPFDFLPRYDQVIHAFGFGSCAVLTREALQAHLGRPVSINLPLGAIIFLTALGLGCINEIIEFAVTLTIPETNVGGYINTGWDLVSNSVGALLAIAGMKIKEKMSKTT